MTEILPNGEKRTCTITDPTFDSYVKASQKISITMSGVDFFHPNPYCLRVPSNNLDAPLTLTSCLQSSSMYAYPTMPDGTRYNGGTVYDNQFYHNTAKRTIMPVRDRNRCLQVNPNNNTLINSTCNEDNNSNNNQKFTFENGLIKSVQTGKCLTAPGFTSKAEDYHSQGKTGSAFPDISITMETCPTKRLDDLTAFDNAGDSFFQFGEAPKISANIYIRLRDAYDAYRSTVNRGVDDLQKKYDSALKKFEDDKYAFNLQIAQYDVKMNEKQVEITTLQHEILNNKKRTFELILAQTENIQKTIKTLEIENKTENKSNSYQLEQNKKARKIYKIIFWVYFVVLFVFLMVVFLKSFDGNISSLFFACIILVFTVVYPFAIVYIEYILVFVYYYCVSLVFGVPFTVTKGFPTWGNLNPL